MNQIAVIPDMLHIIEGEFKEMPGMRLTEAQFRRLWSLAPQACQQVTATLLKRGVLMRDADGRFCRRDDLHD